MVSLRLIVVANILHTLSDGCFSMMELRSWPLNLPSLAVKSQVLAWYAMLVSRLSLDPAKNRTKVDAGSKVGKMSAKKNKRKGRPFRLLCIGLRKKRNSWKSQYQKYNTTTQLFTSSKNIESHDLTWMRQSYNVANDRFTMVILVVHLFHNFWYWELYNILKYLNEHYWWGWICNAFQHSHAVPVSFLCSLMVLSAEYQHPVVWVSVCASILVAHLGNLEHWILFG